MDKAGHNNRSIQAGENGENDKPIIIVFRFSDYRRRDLDGALATVMDCLVKAGKIPDDCCTEIGSIIATWIKVQKGKEGVDIIL